MATKPPTKASVEKPAPTTLTAGGMILDVRPWPARKVRINATFGMISLPPLMLEAREAAELCELIRRALVVAKKTGW